MPIRVLQAAPEAPRPVSTAEDMARAAPTGLMQGAASLTGSVGDLRELGETGLAALSKRLGFKGDAPKLNAPWSPASVIGGAMEKMGQRAGLDATQAKLLRGAAPGGFMALPSSGDLLAVATRNQPAYEPKTKAGKYTKAIAQFAPAALMPGSALRRGANVVLPAVASEAAGQATEGTKFEPYARVAAALVGSGVANLAGRGGPDTRLLAEASRGASDAQIGQARTLMQDAQDRGVRLTMAEALQQVTNSGTGMGRMQRVIEGTRGGNTRISPVIAERPAQVRQAVASLADRIAPPASNPYVMGQQAQEGAGTILTGVRQQINANARPFYEALNQERLLSPGATGSRFSSVPVESGGPLHSFNYTAPSGEEVSGFLKPPPQGGGPLELDVSGPGLSVFDGGAGRLGIPGVRDLGAQIVNAYPEATSIEGLRVTGARSSPTTASVSAARLKSQADMVPTASQAYQALLRNPAYHEALVAVRHNPILNERLARLPDDSLAVMDEVTKQLGTLAENARPNPTASTGNAQMSAAYDAARNQADQLASSVSEPWRLSRAMVASGREAFLEPLQGGPIGAISQTADLAAQTRSLYPATPMEGAPSATAQALTMLEQQQPGLGAGLTRQHLVNSANEATQDLQSGANPWGGAKWAATQMGNPEQARTLEAGVGAVGGDAADLNRLAEVLRATGKRQPPGSLTAYNARDLEELGKAGVIGEGLRTGLNPPGVLRRLGQGFQDWQTERNAGRLAEAILANPADAERILLHAREVVPHGQALQAIEQAALAAQLSRQQQLPQP